MSLYAIILISAAMGGIPQSDSDTEETQQVTTEKASSTEAQEDANDRRFKVGNRFYEGDEVVCKRERVTGTRVKKRICNTARQWVLIEENTRALTEEMRTGVNSINENPTG
ncbi:hypothetical protein ACR9YC_02735 [Parasphingorhabdus sp. DH2-15]|uniref:hypothetical protein n=1 Tax=Parasphingorhabdus sp. DH2-15 TaxID=3444112 RepID=UPI003F685F36